MSCRQRISISRAFIAAIASLGKGLVKAALFRRDPAGPEPGMEIATVSNVCLVYLRAGLIYLSTRPLYDYKPMSLYNLIPPQCKQVPANVATVQTDEVRLDTQMEQGDGWREMARTAWRSGGMIGQDDR